MKTAEYLVNSMDEALKERVRQELHDYLDAFDGESQPKGAAGQFEAARWLADNFPGELACFTGYLLHTLDSEFDNVATALEFADAGGLEIHLGPDPDRELAAEHAELKAASHKLAAAAFGVCEALEVGGYDLSTTHAGALEAAGNALAKAVGFGDLCPDPQDYATAYEYGLARDEWIARREEADEADHSTLVDGRSLDTDLHAVQSELESALNATRPDAGALHLQEALRLLQATIETYGADS